MYDPKLGFLEKISVDPALYSDEVPLSLITVAILQIAEPCGSAAAKGSKVYTQHSGQERITSLFIHSH